jgi:acyl carrier protein
MRVLRDVLVTEFAMDPKLIMPEARLVEDLGLD